MKNIKQILLSALLILALLLSSCGVSTFSEQKESLVAELSSTSTTPTELSSQPTETREPTSTDPTQSTEEGTDTEEASHELNTYVPYSEFEREYEPYLEQVSFSEIEYVSPDSEPIIKGYEDLKAMVEEGSASAKEIVAAYEEVFEDHLFFDTMNSLAYIRYSLDLNNTYYDEEYNRCEELSPLINQAQEKCYVAMSESPLRSELEEEYFGEGFFLFYDENRIYSKDSVVALMQEASAVESQYMALQNDTTIMWNGVETSLDSLLEDPNLSYKEYLAVYQGYYDKYNPLAADLYVQLIRIRKEIAKELGYDSYADFAYHYLYERDYTPQQVATYCDDIADELPSLLITAYMAQMDMPSANMNECLSLFKNVVDEFGGVIKMSYEFMEDYELWDTTSSPSKLPGSYMTYLNSYEMPFMYVSPANDLGDLMTLCHEFGHFVDGYVNCGGFSTVDCCEIFSQGLEFLALNRADLDPGDRAALASSKAADSVLVFLTQACYAEFEALAYELPDDKLNAEGLNELYAQCNEKYGISLLYMGMEDLLAPGWIDVQHFFIAPFYVISYCVSNDVALQIYQQELADQTGLELYYSLMSMDRESSILELAEGTDLVSPFDPGRIKDLADFLDDQIS